MLTHPRLWQGLKRWSYWMLTTLFALLCLASQSLAAQIDDEGELYIVDVLSYGYKLGEGVPVYLYQDREYIQFELFLEFLEFPISEQEGRWQGWFNKEENTFALDVEGKTVSYPGSDNEVLQPGSIYDSEDGLVVSREALQQWFALELELDLRQQVVQVRSEQTLPFQQQLEQEAKLNRGGRYLEPEVGKPVADQYHWLTEPQIDFTSAVQYYDTGAVTGNSLFMSLNASMDFLKHGMLYSGSLSSNQITKVETQPAQPSSPTTNDAATHTLSGNHSLTFFRRADSETGSIAAGIDFYEFGDIFGTGNLVSSGGGGLGINIGRSQKNSQAALGKTNINGIAPANWLAELYRDGVLLDIGRVDADGQYRFPDRDLNYGQNLFLVRLEGPQGEVLEHRYPIWGGGSELAAGEHNFDFLYIDHRRQVFGDIEGDDTTLPATRTFESTFSYGLSSQAEVGVGFTSIERYIRSDLNTTTGSAGSGSSGTPIDYSLRSDQYLTLSGQKNVGIGALTLDFVQQQQAGNTSKLGFLGKYWGQSIYFNYQLFNDYSSPANRGRENLSGLSEFKIESPLAWYGFNYYGFGVVHKAFIDGRQNVELRNSFAGHWNRIDINNELIVQRNYGTVNYQGRLRFSTRFWNSSMRGELTYAPGRNELFQRLALDWTYRISQRLSNNIKVIQSLKDDNELSVKNRLTWRFPSVDFGMDFSWNDGNYSLGLNVTTAFGYDRQAKHFFRSRTGLANTGKVALQLFVDGNNNGMLDSDEETLQDVYYRSEDLVSGEVGGLLLNRVPERNVINIKTDDLVFKDGFLVPTEPRYAIYTHAGSTVDLPIPVVSTGDIEGMVYRLDANGRKTRHGKLGVKLELVSEDGRVTRTTRSQFDGYYGFVEVPIGRYHLRVVGKYADPDLAWDIVLDEEEGYVEVEDFHVY